MKKTLAILLALMMASSVALVACEGGRTPVEDDWDDNDYVEDSDDETEDTTDDSTDSTDTSDESGNNNNNTDITGWVDKNDTVYAGYGINVRANTSVNAEIVYDQVKAGDAISRISSNGTWDKVSVTVNGEAKTGYVLNKWVSTTNNFSFTQVDPAKSLTVTATSGKLLCFFTTPHKVMNGNDYDYTNIVCKGGLTASAFSEGYTLKAIGENTNWLKVELVGKITLGSNNVEGTTENPLTLYIYKSHLEDRIDGYSSSTGGSGNVG